jgi:hypothetical protein
VVRCRNLDNFFLLVSRVRLCPRTGHHFVWGNQFTTRQELSVVLVD